MTEQELAVLAKATENAAKSVKKMMALTMFAVAIAILVLAIDNGIKRAIITESQKIKGMVGRFEEVARGAEAGQGGAGDVPADGGADAGGGGVADDAGARAAADGGPPAGRPAGAGRAGSRKPGP